jgi:hypothetical protein
MKAAIRTILLSLLLTQPLLHAAEIASGDGLVRAMHDRYVKSWYQTLTFTQKSTTYNPDGTTKVETWYEAALLPGKLRIDIGPPADGRAYLMVDGNATIFQQGKEVKTRSQVNMLLVLGFDVYKQAPETTEEIIRAEKYDLSKLHEESWEGRPVYVVGADKGDLKSPQFWVDKERLLFVRLIQPARSDASKTEDIRFEAYGPLAGGWLAARVEVWEEGKMVFTEEYSEIKADRKLDAALFDPKQFNAERRP